MQPDRSWTVGGPDHAPDEGLHETLARLTRRRPGAVALVCGPRTVTYAELDRTADAWAARLAAAGAGPGRVVPILLPRSIDLVTALLAVLKTGAAYALLDPAWPAERIDELLGELDPPVVVGRPGWTPPAGPVPAPRGFTPATVRAADPCCVFFTSGTTGPPKGVLTTHRAIARLFGPHGFARFTASSVLPLAAPGPWDAFALELWSVLLSGGTSVLVTEPYLSAHALRDAVSRHGVDTVWLTSSLFNLAVDEDPDAFTGLCQVMVGGERLSPDHVARFLRRHPAIVLLNGYGPVESTVFATTHRVTEADCTRPDGIPLGRPVPGTRVLVLAGDRVCAVGEPGEICLAGSGLAIGYLGDPARTAERFRTVELDGTPVRVYRTGDIGVWGPDGLLRFRGRADRQLKIRGHRVEPAEVEAQIRRALPDVRDCRVLARRDAAGLADELVAFCVPAGPTDAAARLAEVLLPHHRPAAVVSVAAFPVTERGKLDEPALLALARPNPEGTAALPADPTLRAVAETFGAVLGRVGVPLDVPFTRLGGGSLAAGRACARLAVRLGRPVPVAQLYRHPTAEALAAWLDASAGAGPEPAARPDTVPLTPMQLVYLTRDLVDPADRTGHCLLAWVIEGSLDRVALAAAVAAVHRRHEPLRAAYRADPTPHARVADVSAPVPVVLDPAPSVDAALAALRAELAGDLDPTTALVWRTALVPAGRATVFGVAVHHIAFDGASESVLARDLAAAYAGADPAPEPPALSAVHRIRERHLAHADLAAHTGYLRGELTGVPELRWPADPLDRAPDEPGRVEVRVGPEVLRRVDALAAAAGVTRFTVLLAEYAASLADVTGQRDLAVGVPVAQRGPGLEDAVGCHLNMVCLRLRGAALDGDPTAVGTVVAQAFAAQDVPLRDVLELVRPPRTGRPPLFQTLFALQDNEIPRLELPGLGTSVRRMPYLDLPLELHTELWPERGGGLRVEVAYRPDAVGRSTAEALAKLLTDRLHTVPSGVPTGERR